ncbi:DoxX family protein [Phytomonospora sp. NPDC050363]|uniref:DoxX family protein n=1 Tax=Phytomonospora sp. NPDC050363 TaxID=3155642 RepID=UPI0033DE3C47
MQTQMTSGHAGDEERAGGWSRIRPVAFWSATIVVVFELAAGSVWNLLTIEWIEAQLRHLGFPHFFAYVLGVWQALAAVAIIAPRLPLLKEWAYAGCLFLWSGAVASHLNYGDPIETWGVPLTFGILAVTSWLLRPADRRIPETRLRPNGSPRTRSRAWESRPRAWAVPMALLVAMFAVSVLTLPVVEASMLEFAVELGWVEA